MITAGLIVLGCAFVLTCCLCGVYIAAAVIFEKDRDYKKE